MKEAGEGRGNPSRNWYPPPRTLRVSTRSSDSPSGIPPLLTSLALGSARRRRRLACLPKQSRELC